MKILITGVAGFIASHLAERLLSENHEVWGIDNLNNYYSIQQKQQNLDILNQYPNFHFKKDDLVTTTILQEINFDVVFNIGAMAGVRYSLENPEIYYKTNVEGQAHLLNECVKSGCKKFIYASSSSVYGNNTKVPFCETDEINNLNSPYAVSKKNTEEIAKLYSKLYNIQTIGLRFFTVYGERGRPDMAPYKFLSKIMNKEPIDKYGIGNSYRDYTYISDIIDGIMGTLTTELKCTVFNLGNGTPITLNEFISLCEKITGNKAIINQMGDQMGDVPATYASIEHAKKEIGYSPKVKFEEGLERMYFWLKNYY